LSKDDKVGAKVSINNWTNIIKIIISWNKKVI
jgi:hypothetical protein